ncbi:MAG TPA: alpha/beta hydrolase [Sporichthyaceae bacterium]|jgi:pimeloyl-ACP methyl ester carboxylesterase|nr:alpha/beta hydrolase [Sporichthyaceae bacterium]
MRIPSLLAAAVAAVTTIGLLSGPASAVHSGTTAVSASDVVKIPISFHVKNTNNTEVYCEYPADGRDYTVRGLVVGPRSAIRSGQAATLYLHAVTWTSDYFNLPIPGHNYAEEMAKRGHVSIAVDRLGYGKSDEVPGLSTCFGSEADVAHQMVAALKSGNYTLGNGAPTKFAKVFTSGSSVGGLIANIEAYTFKDTAGVFNQSWGDWSAGPYALSEAFDANFRCYQGGDYFKPGRPEYATFAAGSRDEFYFASATKEVRDKTPAMQPDPCGQLMNLQFAIGTDMQHLGDIGVPVLMTFGDADPVFPPPSAQQMQARYSGSSKVTSINIPGASHYPILEEHFPVMVDAANAWLAQNGG